MRITTIAVKRPITTLMIFLGFGMLGIISWFKLPIQILPRMVFPDIYLNVNMKGYSPEAIERELIIPLEEQIGTLDHIEEINSTSYQDYGIIKISYHFGTDMKLAFLKLQQKVSAIEKSIPIGSSVSIERQDTEDLSKFLMELNLRGSDDVEYLREFAERKIKPKLEQIDGVVAVFIGGGRNRIVEVKIDEDKCHSYNIPISSIKQKLETSNVKRQFLGVVTEKNQNFFVTIDGRFTDIQEIENLVIDNKTPVFLKNVADIRKGFRERTSYFRINGKQSLGVWVLKDDLSNLIKLSNDVLKVVDELNRTYERDDIYLKVTFNQAEWMQKAIDKVEKLALVGIFLALLVLLFFIKNIRIVSVLMLAIPTSLLITFFIMLQFDLTVNMLSLVGLALAIGMLVDNGIVVLESIFRHFEKGKDTFNAVDIGCDEVSRSVIASTLTTVIVFLPFLFVRNEVRIIGKELSLSVIIPLLVSLFVALTLIPMVTSKILKNIKARDISRFKISSYKNRLLEIYTLLLKMCLRYPARTIVMVLVFFFLTLIASTPFILKSDEGEIPDSFDIYVEMPKGSSLDATNEVVSQVEHIANEIEDKDEIRSRVQEESSTITIKLLEKDKRKTKLSVGEIKRVLRKKLSGVSGGMVLFEKPVSRVGGGNSEGSGGEGLFGIGSKPEKILIRGYDLNKLESVTNEIVTRIEAINEVGFVRSNFRKGKPELQILGNYENLSTWNLSMRDIMDAIITSKREGQQTLFGFKEYDYEIPIELKLKDVDEKTIKELKGMAITTSDLQYIPISEVADFKIINGPSGINRRNQEREVEVSYRFDQSVTKSQPRLMEFRRNVEKTINEIHIPEGLTLEVIYEEEKDKSIYWIFAAAGLLIYIILASVFESFSAPIVILGTIPLATIGSFWALTITGTSLFVGMFPMGLLGMLILLGIVVNNGILLIDYTSILRSRGFSKQRAIITAGQARVRPILMTSFTTILGIFPLAFKTGQMGEIWVPFAISVVGGLSVSSLFTLIFIPTVYSSFDNIEKWFRFIGFKGILFNVCAILFLGIYSYFNIDSLFWKIITLMTILMGIPSVTWIFYKIVNILRKKPITFEKDIHIKIKNLTKIYDDESRFVKEWKKRKRREMKIIKSGGTIYSRRKIFDNFMWQIPLYCFLIYFTFIFLENTFWKTIFSASMYFFTRFMVFQILYIFKDDRGISSKNLHIVENITRKVFLLVFPALLFLYYRHIWDNTNGAIFWACVWYIMEYMLVISGKIRRKEIDLNKVSGRFARLRKIVYNIIFKIPIIGKKGEKVKALDTVSLEFETGMFGLLGPNGAGKTTLMRLLCNIIEETRGSVFINDLKLSENREDIQSIIGYLPQEFGLYENMTAFEYLHYYSILYGIDNENERIKKVNEVLQEVSLFDRKDEKLKNYSGGMKQRVGIARTLLHLPKIVIVDEPTAGLDPAERIRFRNFLGKISQDRVVILSTHIVEDISSSCNNIAVLNHGRILYTGSPQRMIEFTEGKVWSAEVTDDEFENIRNKLTITHSNRTDGNVKIRFISEDEGGLKAEKVEPTLEDAYIYLLGKSEIS
jgi:multidrug efflux pump subunit AcrB/ABC-type multidrug transport system ATPase subunit